MDSPIISLGISLTAKYGAACLMHPRGVIASAVEERGGARKARLPVKAIQFCLQEANIKELASVDILSIQSRHASDWLDFLSHQFTEEKSWIDGILTLPQNLRRELRFRAELRRDLESIGGNNDQLPEITIVGDQQAIAHGLYSSQSNRNVAILVLDTPFERSETGLWVGRDGDLENIWTAHYPQSFEHLLASLASFCGFRGRMGQRQFLQLAEYGEPRFVDVLKTNLIELAPSGRFSLNMAFLPEDPSREMEWKGLTELLGEGPRKPDQPISSREIDLALATTQLIEFWILALAATVGEGGAMSPLIVRGQGPFHDRFKLIAKRIGFAAKFGSIADESLIMAAGAARFALTEKGAKIQWSDPLPLRADRRFEEPTRSTATTERRIQT